MPLQMTNSTTVHQLGGTRTVHNHRHASGTVAHDGIHTADAEHGSCWHEAERGSSHASVQAPAAGTHTGSVLRAPLGDNAVRRGVCRPKRPAQHAGIGAGKRYSLST